MATKIYLCGNIFEGLVYLFILSEPLDLITNDTLTVLELWTEIKDYWADIAIRVVEIRKLKSSREIEGSTPFHLQFFKN